MKDRIENILMQLDGDEVTVFNLEELRILTKERLEIDSVPNLNITRKSPNFTDYTYIRLEKVRCIIILFKVRQQPSDEAGTGDGPNSFIYYTCDSHQNFHYKSYNELKKMIKNGDYGLNFELEPASGRYPLNLELAPTNPTGITGKGFTIPELSTTELAPYSAWQFTECTRVLNLKQIPPNQGTIEIIADPTKPLANLIIMSPGKSSVQIDTLKITGAWGAIKASPRVSGATDLSNIHRLIIDDANEISELNGNLGELRVGRVKSISTSLMHGEPCSVYIATPPESVYNFLTDVNHRNDPHARGAYLDNPEKIIGSVSRSDGSWDSISNLPSELTLRENVITFDKCLIGAPLENPLKLIVTSPILSILSDRPENLDRLTVIAPYICNIGGNGREFYGKIIKNAPRTADERGAEKIASRMALLNQPYSPGSILCTNSELAEAHSIISGLTEDDIQHRLAKSIMLQTATRLIILFQLPNYTILKLPIILPKRWKNGDNIEIPKTEIYTISGLGNVIIHDNSILLTQINKRVILKMLSNILSNKKADTCVLQSAFCTPGLAGTVITVTYTHKTGLVIVTTETTLTLPVPKQR